MRVELHNRAKKQLGRINEPYLSAVIMAINKLECEPPEGDIIKLQGRRGYRARVRGVRILFQIKHNKIIVTDIGQRGQIYNK